MPDFEVSPEVDQHFSTAMRELAARGVGPSGQPELMALLLAAVGAAFDEHKIVSSGDPNRLELRGRFGGLPIKVELSGLVGLVIEIESKIQTDQWDGFVMELRYDLTKVPTEGGADDPFAEDEGHLAFVAKGLFLYSDYPDDLERSLAFWGELTPELRERVIAVATGHEVPRVLVFGDGIRAWPGETGSMERPLSQVVDLCDLMSRLAPELLASDAVRNRSKVDIAFGLVGCSYCGSKFALYETRKCPNCGAGYQGQ